MKLRSVLCALILLSVVAGDCDYFHIGEAHADFIADRPFRGGRRNIEINLHLSGYYGYGWYNDCGAYRGYNDCAYWGSYAVGPGFQMLFPVVQNGFIPSINNAFYVGFFTDFAFFPTWYGSFQDGWVSLAIGPMAQWRFNLFDAFSVFANVGFGIWPWFVGNHCDRSYGCYDYGTVLRFFPLLELGGNIHLTKAVALTFSLGYPSSKFGVSFGF